MVATWWETAEWVAPLSPLQGGQGVPHPAAGIELSEPAGRAPVEATWRLPMQKIVVSRWLADMARNRFGDPTSIIVPNGIDLDLFYAPPRGKQPRPTVGMLYVPAPHKGNVTALAAIDIAARRIPGLHVRAFGIGELVASMPLPPGSDYTRRPPQHFLREIYARCDVWLCASTSEGYHLPPRGHGLPLSCGLNSSWGANGPNRGRGERPPA